ncbi:release factor [Astrocystis sublimbata]|nr:release factor [Astrocystis sublimbata]
MLPAQWICRRCITALTRSSNYPLARLASTNATSSLPRALLDRARSIAKEHDQLVVTLESDFDPKTAKRVGELSRVASALKEWETAQASIAELTALLQSKDAAKDEELEQLAREELSTTRTRLEPLATALSASLTPRDPFADMPCMVEVRPGPGGMEGRYFADALFRMYRMYCARLGLQTKVVKYEIADGSESTGGANESPLQEAVLEILDAGAYDRFRGEAGMHRVQRVPTTERSGRTHTSAVAVWVLPSFPEDNSSDQNFDDPDSLFYVNPADVREDKMRASGAGGQHVNKTESAIRLAHEPTGVTVVMQDSRSQHANRKAAWTLLRSRLAQKRREEREEAAAALRNSVLSREKITRGDKIRTYNYSQDRCSDHRSGLDVHNLPDVLGGGETFDKIIDSTKEWLIQRDIQALIAEEEATAAIAESKASKKAKR